MSTANGQAGAWLSPTQVTATVRAGDSVGIAEALNAASGSEYSSSFVCEPKTGAPVAGQGLTFTLAEHAG